MNRRDMEKLAMRFSKYIKDEPKDYSFINSSIEGRSFLPSPQGQKLLRSFSSHSKTENSSTTMSNSSGNTNSFERPSKTLKTFPSNNLYPYIIFFNNEENPEPLMLKPKGKKVVNQNKESTVDSVTRSHNQHHDHIIAERKRREKISQQFIELSALIPALKKVDKASVLEGAIKHVKQLQEQVKLLEDNNQRQVKLKTASTASKLSLKYDKVTETSLSKEDLDFSVTSSNLRDNSKNRSTPKVEARVSKRNVLIRIHCEKHEGVLMKIIKEIEKLHLSITNSSTLVFGASKLDITIIAEMEEEFSSSVHEVARSIGMAVLQFM